MELQEQQLARLTQRIIDLYGHDFRDYSYSSLQRRVAHTMTMLKVDDFEHFMQQVTAPETFAELFKHLSINVTQMFRNPEVFAYIREHLVAQLASHPHIRIWCAGVASGEEAWSLAILLHEEGILDRSLIYATDFNDKVLKQAQNGQFPIKRMAKYTQNYIASGGTQSFSSYYSATDKHAFFDPQLKQNIVFANHNLATDASFNEFHLILCRNVLIYFNPQLTKKVINVFDQSLTTGGILVLGDKENLNRLDHGYDDFKCIHQSYKLYKKQNVAAH